jgi:hypothetical protein
MIVLTKAAATMPGPVPPILVITASNTILRLIPTAPKSIRVRRPNLSMVKTAIQDAAKYSVPFPAAKSRDFKLESPICSS